MIIHDFPVKKQQHKQNVPMIQASYHHHIIHGFSRLSAMTFQCAEAVAPLAVNPRCLCPTGHEELGCQDATDSSSGALGPAQNRNGWGS